MLIIISSSRRWRKNIQSALTVTERTNFYIDFDWRSESSQSLLAWHYVTLSVDFGHVTIMKFSVDCETGQSCDVGCHPARHGRDYGDHLAGTKMALFPSSPWLSHPSNFPPLILLFKLQPQEIVQLWWRGCPLNLIAQPTELR